MLTRLKNWLNNKSSSGKATSADRDSNGSTGGRNTYIRENTGTHKTVKTLDDSLVDPDEADGIDPYNTGGFDRSKNWNNTFGK